MSASDEPRRVHFQSPEYLVERLDAIAELMGTDRTTLLVDAIREYLDNSERKPTPLGVGPSDSKLVQSTRYDSSGCSTASSPASIISAISAYSRKAVPRVSK